MMSKILLEINMANYGSTGRIMLSIAKVASESGYDTFVACANYRVNKQNKLSNQIFIGNYFERNIEILLDKKLGIDSILNYFGTKKFLKTIDKINPDLIHLHNLPGGYINIELLFNYIKKKKVPVVWTLHDCWAFTGHCPYFDYSECNNWVSGCGNCKNLFCYPRMDYDGTKLMWAKKNRIFNGVNSLTIVTPSDWLKRLVEKSFLNHYCVKVINNGINHNIFKPTYNIDLKNRFEGRYVILGVALEWGKRKGLDYFCRLASDLDEEYQIILVGTDDVIDRELPSNIVSIHRTNSQKELAEYYTISTVFVNPTREDNFPTVNIEALACGTPVVCFNSGGTAEIIDDSCGIAVETGDYEGLLSSIIKIKDTNCFSKDSCIARSKLFQERLKFNEYVELYNEVLWRN